MLIAPSNPAAARPSLHDSTVHSPIQILLTSLRSPFASLKELEAALLQPLGAFDVIPQAFKPSAETGTGLSGGDVLSAITTIQLILLNVILPTWLPVLRDAGREQLVQAFFCPSLHAHAMSANNNLPRESRELTRCKIVVSALPTLLSHLPTLNPKDSGPAIILTFCISTLSDIVSLYPLDAIHRILFSSGVGASSHMNGRRLQEWEDYVRSVCAVPGRVANALQEEDVLKSSEKLEHGSFFSGLCVSTEKILFRISQQLSPEPLLPSLSHLLLKLLHLGLFPSTIASLPSQPSFFSSILPIIRRRLHLTSIPTTTSDVASSRYADTWAAVVRSLPLTSQQKVMASLLGALRIQVGRDTSPSALRKVGDAANVLRGMLGKLGETKADMDDEELWGSLTATICGPGRTWDIGVTRAVVCWIADPQESKVNNAALEKLLDAIVAIWTNPDSIRHSLLMQHRYTTSLFLIVFASLTPTSSAPDRLALSPPFVASISTYLGHLDVAVRQCGMLTAEVVAARCGKKLKFDGWEGAGEGLEWARAMRGWQPDWAAEGFQSIAKDGLGDPVTEHRPSDTAPPPDTPLSITQAADAPSLDSDDDSLRGYDSPTSSRSPSPTPSELAEMEKDPTLRVGRSKPVARPVYLAQLVTLLRTSNDDDAGGVERIEVALASAETLIRRKKGFGLELEENAVELTIAFVGLQDNYELEGFEEKKQGALNVLVECCPRKTAMTLVEQFFTNQYSTSQRFAILTALALGARALAGLPVPPPRVTQESVTFPSKMLPPALHRRYGTLEEQQQGGGGGKQVQQLLHGITTHAMERSKAEVENAIPEVVRERQLRVGRLGSTSRHVTEVGSATAGRTRAPAVQREAQLSFADVAAEHFIMPLVNHMWLHLRDLEARAPARRGAGTGMILGAIVLAQYLGTLSVLAHAARHSSAFLAVVAPGVLEIAVALGSRRAEDMAGGGKGEGGRGGANDPAEGKEAAVITAALEVALVALDACVDLDGGRTLGLEHTALVLAVGEWAGGLLTVLEGGRRISGGGGAVEGRVGGAAAGVIVKVDRITQQWGRSMVGF